MFASDTNLLRGVQNCSRPRPGAIYSPDFIFQSLSAATYTSDPAWVGVDDDVYELKMGGLSRWWLEWLLSSHGKACKFGARDLWLLSLWCVALAFDLSQEASGAFQGVCVLCSFLFVFSLWVFLLFDCLILFRGFSPGYFYVGDI